MIVNDNAESMNIKALAKSAGGFVYLFTPSKEDICALDHTLDENGFLAFELDICAYGCAAVLVSATPIASAGTAKSYAEKKEKSRIESIELKDGWRFCAKGGNWLVLPVKMQTKSHDLLALYDCGLIEQFMLRSSEEYGKLGHIAESEFPGGYKIRPGDRYAAYAGFYIRDIPGDAKLVIECEEGMAVLLNGTDITGDLRSVKLWGIRTKSADIAPFLKKGANQLAYISTMPGWNGPHELPCAYLRGDFRLNEQLELIKDKKTIKPDIWTTQGYPHFSGVGLYETEFSLPDAGGKKISIDIPTGDAVKIILNGSEAETLLWEPYTADITRFAEKGENRLRLEFTSTYKSLMQTEEYALQSQGHFVRAGRSKPSRSGLDGFPVIKLC
jgi:hypothetical protein